MKLGIQFIFVVVIFTLMTWWTDSNLGWALTEYKGTPVDTPWWIAFLCVFLGPFNLVFNIVCEIMQFAV